MILVTCLYIYILFFVKSYLLIYFLREAIRKDNSAAYATMFIFMSLGNINEMFHKMKKDTSPFK